MRPLPTTVNMMELVVLFISVLFGSSASRSTLQNSECQLCESFWKTFAIPRYRHARLIALSGRLTEARRREGHLNVYSSKVTRMQD